MELTIVFVIPFVLLDQNGALGSSKIGLEAVIIRIRGRVLVLTVITELRFPPNTIVIYPFNRITCLFVS